MCINPVRLDTDDAERSGGKQGSIFANAASVLSMAAEEISLDDHNLEKELANEVELWRMETSGPAIQKSLYDVGGDSGRLSARPNDQDERVNLPFSDRDRSLSPPPRTQPSLHDRPSVGIRIRRETPREAPRDDGRPKSDTPRGRPRSPREGRHNPAEEPHLSTAPVRPRESAGVRPLAQGAAAAAAAAAAGGSVAGATVISASSGDRDDAPAPPEFSPERPGPPGTSRGGAKDAADTEAAREASDGADQPQSGQDATAADASGDADADAEAVSRQFAADVEAEPEITGDVPEIKETKPPDFGSRWSPRDGTPRQHEAGTSRWRVDAQVARSSRTAAAEAVEELDHDAPDDKEVEYESSSDESTFAGFIEDPLEQERSVQEVNVSQWMASFNGPSTGEEDISPDRARF